MRFTLDRAILGLAMYCWENWNLAWTPEKQGGYNGDSFLADVKKLPPESRAALGSYGSYGDYSLQAARSCLGASMTARTVSSNAYLLWLSFCVLLYREVSAKGHRRATVYFFFKQNQLKDLEHNKLCCRVALACIPIGDLSMWTSTVGKSLQLPQLINICSLYSLWWIWLRFG